MAQAFQSASGGEAAEGRIVLTQWTLRFESDSCTVELPYDQLEIQFRRGDGRVFFRHPKQPDWSVYSSDPQILEHRAFTQRTHLRNQIRAFQERTVWLKALVVTLVFLAFFGLAALLISWTTTWMVRGLVASIPDAWEKTLGESLLDEVKAEKTLVDDPKLAAKLKDFSAPLVAAASSRIEFQFHLVDDPFANAFALPGGHVIMTTGLLKMIDRPEELAGVLAHEFAHVTHRHGFRRIVSSTGPYFIARCFLGDRNGFLGLLAGGSQLLLRQSFSRDYEREADNAGWDYLVAADIDPRGLPEFLKKIRAQNESRGGGGIQSLSSHPPTEERIRHLEGKWKGLKRQSGFIELKDLELK